MHADHDDKPFKVTGVLAPTATPVDRTVHVSLASITALHLDWAAGIPLPGLAILRALGAGPGHIFLMLAAEGLLVTVRDATHVRRAARTDRDRATRYTRRMKRRGFLSLAGAALLAAPWREHAAARAALPGLAGDDICRSPRALPVLVASTGMGELSYQGTHILAYGALKNMAPAFAATGGRLAVAGGGCDDGIAGVKRNLSVFGGLCCPVKGSAAEGLPHLLVAHDLKAVVAHASNDVAGLSMAQLKAVAHGNILDWRALGGEAKPIAQVVRRHCPDYIEPVRTALLDNRPDWSGKALFVDTDEQIVDLVSRFPAGLGVVSWVFARPLVEAGKLRVLALGGCHPGRDPARYPLTGPLSLIFRRWDAARMTPFFDFLYGDAGRAIIARDLKPVTRKEAGYRGASTFGRA